VFFVGPLKAVFAPIPYSSKSGQESRVAFNFGCRDFWEEQMFARHPV
jgi:hypothetical protein